MSDTPVDGVEQHDTPSNVAIYRHTGTEETMMFVGRDADGYLFSVNGGERTTTVPTELWEDYREHLEVDRYD